MTDNLCKFTVIHKFIYALCLLGVPLIFFGATSCYGLMFELPKNGSSLVGERQTTQVQEEENFSDVAERFDIGYYEVLEANPGIDPDNPPINTVLIIPTQYLLPAELKPNTILVNLAEMRLYYQPLNTKKVYIFPVGIGKEDWGTPVGEMTVVKKTKDPTWFVPTSIYNFRQATGNKVKRIIPPGPDNPLGKYSLRLSHGEYLIHGTNFPMGVGRRSTAGCMRLYNHDIEKLYNLVNVGTKVVIINKPYKASCVGKKIYLEAHMPLFEERVASGDNIQAALDEVSNVAKGYSISNVNWQMVRTVAHEHLAMPRAVN